MKTIQSKTTSEQETIALGEQIGQLLRGGEIIELVSDLGGGKTTLTKGIVAGVGSTDIVSSPTFTVSNEYTGAKLRVKHYDFYRLPELGVMVQEIQETLQGDGIVTVVEWAGDAHSLFDKDQLLRIHVQPVADDENAREFTFEIGARLQDQMKGLDL